MRAGPTLLLKNRFSRPEMLKNRAEQNTAMTDIQKMNDIFRSKLSTLPGYQEALSIATQNSKGNLWLIGGTVSRLLVQELYGIPQKDYDFDFLCDELVSLLVVPKGWAVSHAKFGNPTFVKGETEIDVWPLSTQDYVKENNLAPTIENFLKGVPFTVQALVYDVKKKILVGEVGIQPIRDRTFGVNNLQTARNLAARKGTSIDARMQKTADSMGMAVKLSGE